MKTCANCGLEIADEELPCPSCTTDTFISSSPDALGHVISPAEDQFWRRMTFRQFAVFLIRLQALWFFFYAVIDATYLLAYLKPYIHFTSYAYVMLLHAFLNLAMGAICIRYADRIVSWFVKDLLPTNSATILESSEGATSDLKNEGR